MKLRKAILLGLAAFTLALVTVLPARWMARAMPDGVQCGDWAGSIWRGQCRELTLADGDRVILKLASLRWKLKPASLLRLRVSADFQSSWSTGQAAGTVAISPGGTLRLREMSANSTLDHTSVGALPRGWNGRATLQRGEFDWDNGLLGRLGGELVISDLADGRGTALGSYRLDVPAGSTPPFMGKLTDTGVGPVEVDAQLRLAADRTWSLDGRMRQRNPSDVRLSRQLDMLGNADASGWRRLSAAGDFN
jgi:hypothetical protein